VRPILFSAFMESKPHRVDRRGATKPSRADRAGNGTGAVLSRRGPRSFRATHRVTHVSVGTAIALGALLGLAVGIVVSVTTDVPFAPEAGLVLGGLAGWLAGRRRADP
jgi:hypothetical protein